MRKKTKTALCLNLIGFFKEALTRFKLGIQNTGARVLLILKVLPDISRKKVYKPTELKPTSKKLKLSQKFLSKNEGKIFDVTPT